MTLHVCCDCTTKFAPDAPACPHCGCRKSIEEGAEMPKITVHGGATNAGETVDTTAPAAVEGDETPESAEVDATDAEVEDDVTVEVADDDAAEELPVDEASVPERPALNASKADWLTYVQALYPGEDLSELTKAALIERADAD